MPATRKPRAARGGARAIAPAASPAGADTAVLALQLLGRWQRVCNGHISFAAACACFGGGVDLSDFDDLLLDYLHNKFAAVPPLAAYIDAAASPQPGAPPNLKTLLRNVAAQPRALPGGQLDDMLHALETSITSIEEQHKT